MDDTNQAFASLETLSSSNSLNEKLNVIHNNMNDLIGSIHRVSVSLYDSKTDIVKTFLESTDGIDPLPHYHARLSEVDSLKSIADSRRSCLNRTDNHFSSKTHHTKRIKKHGFKTSFTFPMYKNDLFFGFIFINSHDKNAFSHVEVPHLEVFSHLVTHMVSAEVHAISSLRGISHVMQGVTRFRDIETGHHLERVSRYAKTIATYIAPAMELNDEFIENLYLFAPLHDIGKIAVPDHILLKPDTLTAEEYEVIKKHTTVGVEIINSVLLDMELTALNHVDMLINIVKYHHERWNGSGYPDGLEKEKIPIEARIISVADVFDALTHTRVYKDAWSTEKAYNFMISQESIMFDPLCIEGFRACKDKIQTIQLDFKENGYT